jgi:hypothetical protein
MNEFKNGSREEKLMLMGFKPDRRKAKRRRKVKIAPEVRKGRNSSRRPEF